MSFNNERIQYHTIRYQALIWQNVDQLTWKPALKIKMKQTWQTATNDSNWNTGFWLKECGRLKCEQSTLSLTCDSGVTSTTKRKGKKYKNCRKSLDMWDEQVAQKKHLTNVQQTQSTNLIKQNHFVQEISWIPSKTIVAW